MDTEEAQAISEDMARLATRLDNVEGYFSNFDTTLNNHMNDYKVKQESIDRQVNAVESKLSWGFWVIFGLLMTVIAGFIAGFITMLQLYLGGL